jgi:hypothetical protein
MDSAMATTIVNKLNRQLNMGRDLIPEWGLMDEEIDRGVSLQDMLSHRTV